MPAIGLDHYNIRAPQEMLAELRDFYCDVVGLQAGTRPPFASFGYWLYAGQKDVLHLSCARNGEPRNLAPQTPGTFDHVAFSCTDFEAMRARLEQRGITYLQAEVPLVGSRQLFFRDPFGNGVELNFRMGA